MLVVYLQVPEPLRSAVLRTAASAVAPGGLLVVVAHDSDNLAHGYGGPPDPGVLYSAADVAVDLAGSGLDVLRGEQVVREVSTDEGPRQALDALVVAKRAAAPDQRTRTAALFDAVSDTYDAVGVDFFQPIADRLVDLIDLRPGEGVADLGCGKGAVLLPAGRAVGPTGSAVGLDLSPAMVAIARTRAADENLSQVEVAVGDAQSPDLPPGTFDAVTSSLVLFFLPDPGGALEAWRALLRPLGRLAVATFGAQDDVWEAIDGLFQPYLPPAMLDARASGTRGPFASDAGMEGLVASAGFGDVRTVVLDLPVRFVDADHWYAFSHSTGQRAMWAMVPEAQRPAVRARAETLLDRAVVPTGGYVLHQQVRYTLGRAPG